jgi:putative DNA primase/helicase
LRRNEEKLKAEWPAILRWLIEGCLDWQANGLVRPASVLAATKEYFADQDIFTQWLDEECDFEPGNDWKKASIADLFRSWDAYPKPCHLQ